MTNFGTKRLMITDYAKSLRLMKSGLKTVSCRSLHLLYKTTWPRLWVFRHHTINLCDHIGCNIRASACHIEHTLMCESEQCFET
jgi:hypothetical protein